MKAMARYDAASTGRRLRSWNPPASGPNTSIENIEKLRSRNRDAGRNEWAAEAATRLRVVDMVGTGIVARPKTKRVALKQTLSGLWEKSLKEIDADGTNNFYGMQALACHSWEESGEVFARIRARRMSDPVAVPIQVQLLEADMVPMLNTDTYTGLPTGNRIRYGIELDPIGRRVAYWVYKSHPGDNIASTFDASLLTRVPADEMIHVYQAKRPGALRGVPDGTSSIVRMKTVSDFDDAVTEKAKIQNLFAGVIHRPAPTAGQLGTDPLTGQIIEYAENNMPMVGLEPGAVIELAPGEEMTFSNPPATGVGYNDYTRVQNLAIASGRGVPYEMLAGDIVNVSDRTLRVIIQNYRRAIEQKQWLVLIPKLCQAIWDAWVDAAALIGLISLSDVDEAKRVQWSPQAWAYIHPVQDVASKVAEIDAGITSRDMVISSRGDDPDEVDESRAESQAREKLLGLVAAVLANPKIKAELEKLM
ncbi:phage portal protein [Undibacterium sp. Di26W]|uniref:phage portal protein n=1 Tax=Undibacterium sp. Di26W TaxID=3413035 RepID=UPI003BF37A4A